MQPPHGLTFEAMAESPGEDLADLFAGNVAGLRAGLDGDAIEDVVVLVAFDLGDRSDVDTVGCDDAPALLDLKPRNRVPSAPVIPTRCR